VIRSAKVGALWRAASAVIVAGRYFVIAVWIAAAVAAIHFLPSLEQTQNSGWSSLVPRQSPALQTEARIRREFGVPLLSRIQIVQRDPHGLSTMAQARVVARAVRIDLHGYPQYHGLRGAIPVLNTAGLFPGARESSTTAITYLFIDPTLGLFGQDGLAHRFVHDQLGPSDHLVGITGAAPARVAQSDRINGAITWVEVGTVLLIALVVGAYFRSLGAPLATLATALLAYLISTRVLAWAGREANLSIPRELSPLLIVLVLGVVTDYSIFFLSGARHRLAGGEERRPAVRRTTAEFLPIIVAAGLIVAGTTASLVVAKLSFFRAMGPGLAITVAVALAVSITFVPAVIAVFGRSMYWPNRLPRSDAARVGSVEHDTALPERPTWRTRMARVLTVRPVGAVLVAAVVGLLVWAALPLGQARLGISLMNELPGTSEPARAERAAAQGFAPGITSPTELVVSAPAIADRTAALARLDRLLGHQPGIAGVIGPGVLPPGLTEPLLVAPGGGAARYVLIMSDDPLGPGGISTLDGLQHRLPQLLQRAGIPGARTAFAGDTVVAREAVDRTAADLGRIGIAALVVSFLFLAVFLRAVVAPLYLLASSVLALAAALGLTTLFFQHVLGQHGLTYYMPFAAAVLLVALGSDYNVFVVGRIWEEARVRPLKEAIRVAAPRAARAISVAGVALAGSFSLLAVVQIAPFWEFAFAMVVGILLDTFVVRSVLVPSLIALVGPASFWPGRARRAEPPPAVWPSRARPRPAGVPDPQERPA
jgi:RND superfamily putative drug exporter